MDTYLAKHSVRLGQGEPMLLIHGLGHSKEAWDPVLPLLAARYEVVAIDLPGFGGAPGLDVEQNDRTLGAWCEEVLDALGWDRAHLVGNSYGGTISLRMAGDGRARSVTAISPGGMQQGWERRWSDSVLQLVPPLVSVVDRVPWLTSTAPGRRLALSLMFGRPGAMSTGYARSATRSPQVATRFVETLEGLTDLSDLKPIDVPVTIAWGTKDHLLLPWQGERFHRVLPGSRLVKLPGLGHVPMPDDPAMVCDVIVRTAMTA